MASQESSPSHFNVKAFTRSIIKASNPSLKPHVLAVSYLDLLQRPLQVSLFCIYSNPAPKDFNSIVSLFTTTLPSLLNHYFPLAGRIAANSHTGLPEINCNNQGAELITAEADIPLADVEFSDVHNSLNKIQLPYPEDLPLSVQLVRFACGGFSVSWSCNHLLVDGFSISMIMSVWSELARSGELTRIPNHNRSLFAPRTPTSYNSSLMNEIFTPWANDNLINVLSSECFIRRLYYVEAKDINRLRTISSQGGRRSTRMEAVSAHLWKLLASIVATSDTSCRMAWLVNGRPRLGENYTKAMQNYVGNAVAMAFKEASVEFIENSSLSVIAKMVSEAIQEVGNEDHFQNLVDWVEDHKGEKMVEKVGLGLGSPAIMVSHFLPFTSDSDFGFGLAKLVMPRTPVGRFGQAFLQVMARPGGDGSWVMSACVWPRLAAAFESDPERVFKPVNAEYLGFVAHRVRADLISRM